MRGYLDPAGELLPPKRAKRVRGLNVGDCRTRDPETAPLARGPKYPNTKSAYRFSILEMVTVALGRYLIVTQRFKCSSFLGSIL